MVMGGAEKYIEVPAKETVEQERTCYRRAYEGLRRGLEAEVARGRSAAEDWRTEDRSSNVHSGYVYRLTELLEEVDAKV